MPFAGMDDRHARGQCRGQDAPSRLDCAHHCNIIAKVRAKAAGLKKIALQINDQQR